MLVMLDEYRNVISKISLEAAAAMAGTNPKNCIQCIKGYGNLMLEIKRPGLKALRVFITESRT